MIIEKKSTPNSSTYTILDVIKLIGIKKYSCRPSNTKFISVNVSCLQQFTHLFGKKKQPEEDETYFIVSIYSFCLRIVVF